MNSEMIMFTDTKGKEEIVSCNVNFLTRAVLLIRNRRRANRPTRNVIHQDHYGVQDLLVTVFLVSTRHKEQYVRRDHGPNPFICWKLLRHKIYGYDMLSLYLVDGIYPELVTLVKTILVPSDDEHKRIRHMQIQELARKDVERAFGVLKKKWAILANPARPLEKERIMNMMYTCIILHNMIRIDRGKVISPNWYPEKAHQPDDLERSDEQVRAVMRHIRSAQAHQNLRADLVEHVSPNA
uniref:Protein ALP1-like n=1 Tax=Tanacetum cinerariifolium TaxID=118510 RepID=A0A6L2K5R1_TANCI|nr:protein ALP1-like [Tanacetum cinerariifolium]